MTKEQIQQLPTPRTDKVEWDAATLIGEPKIMVVCSKSARSLEQELTAMTEERNSIIEECAATVEQITHGFESAQVLRGMINK